MVGWGREDEPLEQIAVGPATDSREWTAIKHLQTFRATFASWAHCSFVQMLLVYGRTDRVTSAICGTSE